MKGLTLILGAVVATTAVVYLNAGSGADEVDLVAPRPSRTVGVDESTGQGAESIVGAQSMAPLTSPAVASTVESERKSEPETPARDREASRGAVNLFRVLEAPVVQVAPPPPPPAAVEPLPVAPPPKPSFVYLGSFIEGTDLQAIIQVGESVEFVRPDQIIAGFKLDRIESNAIFWTHEPTSTKGRLQARVAQ